MNPADVVDNMKRLQSLHAHFESLTGQTGLTLSYARISAWHELMQRGYTAADVALVVAWIKRQISADRGGFNRQSLQFSRLIQDADLFEDRLNMARQADASRAPRYPRTATPEADPSATPGLTDSDVASGVAALDALKRKIRS